ncbi:MAG TPA: MBL fold metallo-hydrolase [Bacillota bacterium]|nr:MBL fold metallo-hydrolase [Bacillota bacterium]
MEIYKYSLGVLQTNCYLVVNEKNNEAIIIDAGARPEKLLEKAKNYQVKAILLTHAHFDHIAGLEKIRKQTEAPVYIHESEQHWLSDPDWNGSSRWPDVSELLSFDQAENELVDGQVLDIAGLTISVIHTPGHTPGGSSFLIDETLFSGDTLFAGSIGRTDLPGGNYQLLNASILDKLMVLDDHILCQPGHGSQTTIGAEKLHNPYIAGLLR